MLSSSGPSGPLTLWMALAPVLPGSLSHALSLQRALVLLPRLPSLPLVHRRCAAPSPSFSHIVCTLLVHRSSHLRGSLVLWRRHPPLLRILPAHPPSCTAHSRTPSLSYPPCLPCPASHPHPATCPRPVHPHPAAHPRPASLPLVLVLPLILPPLLACPPSLRSPSPSCSPSPLSCSLTLLSRTFPFVPTLSPALLSHAPSHPLHLAWEGRSRGGECEGGEGGEEGKHGCEKGRDRKSTRLNSSH